MEKLHVVLLRKSLALQVSDDNEPENWLPEGYSQWVALGHFDDLFIYELNSRKNFLNQIKEDKANVFKHNDEKSYYHPLYLIPYVSSDKFSNNYRFIAIVRIHFPKSLNFEVQFKDLVEYLPEYFGAVNLPYQAFYATEFSDMVLDVRSNDFSNLVNAVLRFYGNQKKDGIGKKIEIGKRYTYFGINADYLKNSTELPNENDIIPMFSMRFSGYNMEIAKKQINLIDSFLNSNTNDLAKHEAAYNINGIDDVLLEYRNCHSSDLVRLYRTWLFDEEYECCRKSESTTRVGVQISIENDEFHCISEDKKLVGFCSELPLLCYDIARLMDLTQDLNDYGWFHAISEISNSLVRMSKNPIMDEVVYLIAPGMRSFLVNIYDRMNNGKNLSFSYYYDYAESCSYFIEQLMRIEGQLSHHPEIRPVIYDIPVFMLEYTIAFLNSVSVLLQKDDNENNLHTVFLLVPRPCERMSATELFSAKRDMPGLVHLQIPENTLYSPSRIFQELCHEISHYVGEKYRNRSVRKEKYATAIAALIADCIFSGDNNDVCVFFEEAFLGAITNSLENDDLTIRNMSDVVLQAADDLFFGEDTMNGFFTDYFGKVAEGHYTQPVCYPSKDQIIVGMEEFETYISDIGVLFREIYADICMLCILGIDPNEYLELLLQEVELHPNPDSISDEAFAIRIYVTLSAIGKFTDYHEGGFKQTWDNRIKPFIEHIKNNKSTTIFDLGYDFVIPIKSVNALLEYAIICYESLATSLTKNDVADVVRMYRILSSDDFKYPMVLHEIEHYRAKTMDSAND